MFGTLPLIGWLSLYHLVLFLELWSILSFGPYFFFVLLCLLHCKWWSLRYSPGWGNPLCCGPVCGEGSEREQCCLFDSWWLSVTTPATHKQIGPWWCWFLGGWLCVCSRTLWVFPTNPLVRLGVYSAAATSTGFYSQRFWGFISLHCNPGLCGMSRSPVVPLGLSAFRYGTARCASCSLATDFSTVP